MLVSRREQLSHRECPNGDGATADERAHGGQERAAAHLGLRLVAVFGVRRSLRDRDVMPTFLEGGAVQLSSATQVPKER